MRLTAQNRFKALTSACVLSMMATVAWSQTLTWLGTLGGNASEALDVSADGSVVVGWSRDAAGVSRAFRWTSDLGMRDLGTLGGTQSWAYAVSADGGIVVGMSYTRQDTGSMAFRWTETGNMQSLGAPPGHYYSSARDVSDDGQVVVGWASPGGLRNCPFRWSEDTGMQCLSVPSGYTGCDAMSVSADGSIVVGDCYIFTSQYDLIRAYLWNTATGQLVPLGTLGGRDSAAYAVSSDGRVVVGASEDANRAIRAFRWENGVMMDLSDGYAFGVSEDGSIVVGVSPQLQGAFRWTATDGLESLNDAYACLLNGSTLVFARSISSDGRYIVGLGYNAATQRREAFLLDTRCTPHNGDVNSDRCVDDADLLAVLAVFGNTGSSLCRVDVNCDQTVDDADLLTVLFNFGSGC